MNLYNNIPFIFECFYAKRHPVARRGIVKVPNQKVARQSKCTGFWLHHHDHCHAQMQSVCHTTLWSWSSA